METFAIVMTGWLLFNCVANGVALTVAKTWDEARISVLRLGLVIPLSVWGILVTF